jgi:integrase
MRRWQRLNISRHSVIEWMGKPVKNTYRGFVAARIDAGLDNKVVQHTLRHTAVSWYLQAGESPAVVADYVGMTEQILRDTYKHIMPGAFKTIHTASQRFGRA